MMAAPNVVSEICARCDGRMVAKPDAVGRIRLRCPKCDGVSPPRPRHPDDAMIPQGLIHLVGALPAIAPGQLRCQRCASGVEGRKRFCEPCAQSLMRKGARPRSAPARQHGTIKARCYAPKASLRCGLTFQPSGPRALYCEAHR